ncbi:MAG: gamma-glutamyltransferase [Acidobacteriota bacterium]
MSKSRVASILMLSLALVSCSPAANSGGAAAVAHGQVGVGRVAIGSEGAVVSVDGFATEVGLDVLRAGGNAIDAAVAVGFTLSVTHPAAGNLGGGGFMTIYLADQDRYTTLDFRERAPAAATQTMYLDDTGRPVRGLNKRGWLAVGVPGTVAGFDKAHSQWGRLPWNQLVEPAIQLASDGILLSPYLARSLASVAPTFRDFPASQKAFLRPDGSPYEAGARLKQPDLAWSLGQIAEAGAAAFYKGKIAERLAAGMAANGGLITTADLASYQAVERAPIRGSYRGYEIVSMGPPSSGGVALVEMLNMLENFDLSAYGPNDPEAVHLMIESMRQAYLDRSAYLGDTDYVDVPIERLTSKDYARKAAAAIIPGQARHSAELGADILVAPEPMETTHYSVVDGWGNVVSTTYTIELGYGSRAMAEGTGFLLNNEMGDFNEWPGVTDQRGYIGTQANLIEPGKRMLSSMTPTIVAHDGKPVLVVGSPGGKTIINTVLRVIVNVIDFGLSLPDAVAAPRIHHQWMPDKVYLESSFPAGAIEALRRFGHDAIEGRRRQGDAHCIFIYPDGARLAVADPRRAGAAGAY